MSFLRVGFDSNMARNSPFIRKSVDQIRAETADHGLKRSLGPFNLMFLGVGSTIGAGIYVMTGTAAASFAGPAVLISFVLAGFACAFAALRSEEHTSELQSLMRNSYAVFCLKKKKNTK